eukprot:scaffold90794_cov23-Cyclotella_meneghiniana.AAC.2
MMNLTVNGEQVFHTFVQNQSGYEQHITRCVIPCDPNNPYTPAIRQFAKNCVANLHCFLYHHLTKTMGFHESTVYRLVNCCFLNDAAIADQSDWDPVLQKATPRFRNRLDVMRNRNRQYDFKRKSANSSGDATGTPSLGNCAVEMTDTIRKELLQKLRVNPDKTMRDVVEGDGRASVLTDMPGKSVCTDKTDANTLNNERNNQDLAIKLALERRERSEIEASFNARYEDAMKQIEHFKALAMSHAVTSPQTNWTENPELVSEMQKLDNTADAARNEMAAYKKAHMAELEALRKQRDELEALRKERDELRAQKERDEQELRARKGTPHLSSSGTPPPDQPDDRGGGGRRA